MSLSPNINNLEKDKFREGSDGTTTVRVSVVDDLSGATSSDLATIVDDASSTVTYVGTALIGSATSSAVWKIKKLTESGSLLIITWADGNSSADNVWDDRASLTYS
jgi:hypothetical protein